MSFAIDHVFVLCDVGAPEAEALLEIGLREGTPNRHPGQGTANRRFFLENAYLELLWVEAPEETRSGEAGKTGLFERWKARRSRCPFGIVLRRENGVEPLPFRTWSYVPSYLPPGVAIDVAEGGGLDEPALFALDTGDRPRATGTRPGGPRDARRLTGLEVAVLAGGSLSEGLGAIERLGLLRVERGDAPLLRVECDRGVRGRLADLAPRLPVSVRW